MKGTVFNIKRYSVHDGPGIRVTFFLKGCPLACRWCHNPEGMSPDIEDVIRIDKIAAREFHRKVSIGSRISVAEVLEVLEKESIFAEKSGGGVTFSGGEPLLQAGFLKEALRACRKKGFHTAVDTSGYCPTADLKDIIPHTDLFLFDLKHLDPVLHKRLTGVSNRLILKNLSVIIDSGRDIMLRIPVIPGYNDSPDHLSDLRSYITAKNKGTFKAINLLPYHRIGSAKYKRFNRKYLMEGTEPPSGSRMKELKDFFSESGIKTKIGG